MSKKREKTDDWPSPSDISILGIGTWPTPEKGSTIMVGSWPIPDRVLHSIMELSEFLDKAVKPGEEIKEMASSFVNFRNWMCKLLKDALRHAIGDVCKYHEFDPCTEPKLIDGLTRISKLYPYYRRLCCPSRR